MISGGSRGDVKRTSSTTVECASERRTAAGLGQATTSMGGGKPRCWLTSYKMTLDSAGDERRIAATVADRRQQTNVTRADHTTQ